MTKTPLFLHIVAIAGGVEANVSGPYPDEASRYAAAERIADAQDAATDSLFWLDVYADGTTETGAFDIADPADGERRAEAA